jgi:hypothetical protein
MIRLIKEGYLRGIGILKIKNRELLNITGTYDYTQFGLGANIEFTIQQPIHIGFTIGRLTVYIQVLGVQFYEAE